MAEWCNCRFVESEGAIEAVKSKPFLDLLQFLFQQLGAEINALCIFAMQEVFFMLQDS